MIIKEEDYKCIINSTGSNAVGTPFTKKMTEYLEIKGFKKLFKGNPLFYTNIDYTENELNEICEHIRDMRKKYGQKEGKIEVSYFMKNKFKVLK